MHSADFRHQALPAYQRTMFYRWKSAATGDGLPALKDIDLLQKVEGEGALLVIEIHRDADGTPLDFAPIYVCPTLDAATRARVLAQPISRMPGKGPGSEVWSAYMQLAIGGVPLLAQLPYSGHRPDVSHVFELILPLQAQGSVSVDFALTAMTFVPKHVAALI